MRDVQVLQVLQGAHGFEAGVSRPGTVCGVDPAEALGATTQGLPTGVRHVVIAWHRDRQKE